MTKLVYGVGVNDADYPVQPKVNGKGIMCPFYSTWKSMLKRCYSIKYHEQRPTYKDCQVSNEWLTFMTFKKWMEVQPWEGNQIDKDILYEGNKVYSPNTCVFVSRQTNQFLTDAGSIRGEWPIGVYFHRGRYEAQIGIFGKRTQIGVYDYPEEAHQAYRVAKYELAVQLASEQTDPRVAAALIERYKL